jgi:predicted ArsR family transcriptional regulator
MVSEASRVENVAAVASINDPLRRALFDFVAARDAAVSRDEAATALEIPRGTVAFHLDRLERDGLLIAEFRKPEGKTGPGSGRPAKLYRRTESEISVTIPQRRYDLAGELLASAIEESDRTGEPVRASLERVATKVGRQLGAGYDSLEHALTDTGYEPQADGFGGMTLVNCPFHQLAASHTDVICHANFALLRGAVEGVKDTEHEAVFEPNEARCCVRVTVAGATGTP